MRRHVFLSLAAAATALMCVVLGGAAYAQTIPAHCSVRTHSDWEWMVQNGATIWVRGPGLLSSAQVAECERLMRPPPRTTTPVPIPPVNLPTVTATLMPGPASDPPLTAAAIERVAQENATPGRCNSLMTEIEEFHGTIEAYRAPLVAAGNDLARIQLRMLQLCQAMLPARGRAQPAITATPATPARPQTTETGSRPSPTPQPARASTPWGTASGAGTVARAGGAPLPIGTLPISVQVGDVVTATTDPAEVDLGNGTKVLVERGGSFRVDPSGPTIVEQLVGTIRYLIRGKQFEVRSGNGIYVVRGTEFTVTIRPDGSETLVVTEGAVEVSSASGTVTRRAGDPEFVIRPEEARRGSAAPAVTPSGSPSVAAQPASSEAMVLGGAITLAAVAALYAVNRLTVRFLRSRRRTGS